MYRFAWKTGACRAPDVSNRTSPKMYERVSALLIEAAATTRGWGHRGPKGALLGRGCSELAGRGGGQLGAPDIMLSGACSALQSS